MSSISPLANVPQTAGPESRASLHPSEYEGPKRFEEVMRHESQETADQTREASAGEPLDADERTGTDESHQHEGTETASDQDSEARPDEADRPEAGEEMTEPSDAETVSLVDITQGQVVKTSAVTTHPLPEKLPAAGLVELRKEIDPEALGKGALAKTRQINLGRALEMPMQEQVQQLHHPLETTKPMIAEAAKSVQSTPSAAAVTPSAAAVTPISGATGSVDGAAIRVGLPAFQAAVLHEITQPVDPTQATDRARMVEAILRAGGGELRQVAGKVLQLRLNPPELGRVQIRAEQRGGELLMRFEVERLETLKVFQDVLPGLELSLGQASSESVSLELRQTDEFSEMDDDVSGNHQEHAGDDESTGYSEADDTEDEAPFDVLRDGSTVQVTA